MAANDLRLDDGFSTLITLENIPTVKIFEKSVTPPGYDLGGAIETTTMRNIAWRSNAPKQLKTLTAVSATVAYATAALTPILGQLGINQVITITFPDNSTLAFWGWIESFVPGEFTEGEQPTAAMNITPSNRNATGDEVAPTYTAPEESSESA